jgi:hypothetical protein
VFKRLKALPSSLIRKFVTADSPVLATSSQSTVREKLKAVQLVNRFFRMITSVIPL